MPHTLDTDLIAQALEQAASRVSVPGSQILTFLPPRTVFHILHFCFEITRISEIVLFGQKFRYWTIHEKKIYLINFKHIYVLHYQTKMNQMKVYVLRTTSLF